MSAFSSALDRLFGDPNIARDAAYAPADGDAFPVRVVARRTDAITEFGGARLWSETTRFDLRVGEVASPRPGDRVVSPARPSSCRASRCATASGWSGRST